MIRFARLALIVSVSLVGIGSASAAEIVLRSISAWPNNFEFTRQYMKFVERVNTAGKGVVRIQHVGGPEVIPTQQQDTAIRNGVFDLLLGAAAYYNGVVPEADAIYAATKNPVEARENGATKLLDEIWRKKLNAHFLLWQSGKLGFYIYLSKEPKFDKNGVLDLTGLKLRSHAAYKEWFESLNATNVVIPGPEMFSAFERGMLDGTGWSAIAFADLGVEKFVKYRVGPAVWQLDILVVANAPKWDSLPQNVRDIITKAAIEHEIETMETYQAAAKKEDDFLRKSGITLLELKGEQGALHVKTAHDVIWNRLQKRAPENVQALRAKLYQ